MDDDRSFTEITRERGTVIHWLHFKNSKKKTFVNGVVEKQNRRAPRPYGRKKFSERLTRWNVSFYRPATNRASASWRPTIKRLSAGKRDE